MVGSQYQAEVPTGLCSYGEDEKGEFRANIDSVMKRVMVNWQG